MASMVTKVFNKQTKLQFS